MKLPIRPRKKVEAFRAKEWSPEAGKGHVNLKFDKVPGVKDSAELSNRIDRYNSAGTAGIQKGEM